MSTHTHTHTYIYIYIYIYTHTHIYIDHLTLCNVYFNPVAIWNSPEQRHEKKQLEKLLLIQYLYNDYQNNINFFEKK